MRTRESARSKDLGKESTQPYRESQEALVDSSSSEEEDTSSSEEEAAAEKQAEEERGLPAPILLQFLQDLEASGGLHSFTKSNGKLTQLCNKNKTVYGSPSTKRRRSIQNRFAYLKTKTAQEYFDFLTAADVEPSSETLEVLVAHLSELQETSASFQSPSRNPTTKGTPAPKASSRRQTPASRRSTVRQQTPAARPQQTNPRQLFNPPPILQRKNRTMETPANWPAAYQGYDFGTFTSQHGAWTRG